MNKITQAPPRPWAADEFLASQINQRGITRKERKWFAACAKSQVWPKLVPAWMRYRIASRTVRTAVNWAGHNLDKYADHDIREYIKVFAVTLNNTLPICFCCGEMAIPVQHALWTQERDFTTVHVLAPDDWCELRSRWSQQRKSAFRDRGRTWNRLYQEFAVGFKEEMK